MGIETPTLIIIILALTLAAVSVIAMVIFLSGGKQQTGKVKPPANKREDTAVCPNCRTLNQAQNMYCFECGKNLKIQGHRIVFCPYCGDRLEGSVHYCARCGIDVTKELSSASAAMRFAVFGDALSTLSGYNPEGYAVYYRGENCLRTGIRKPADTWWQQVIDAARGELLVNNSCSGARVSGTLVSAGNSDNRTAALCAGNIMPDVIMVYMGMNDYVYGVDIHYFRSAYGVMLRKLRRNYPMAHILCATLCPGAVPKAQGFVFPSCIHGYGFEQYNEAIRECVSAYGCTLIDLAAYQRKFDSIDGIHADISGMKQIASYFIYEYETDFYSMQNIKFIS